jgi:hypothetical protein
LISHSIFLCFNLLLDIDVCSKFFLFHLLLSWFLLHILRSLRSRPNILSLQIWLINNLVEVSVSSFVSLVVAINLFFGRRASISHRGVLLTRLNIPHRRIFWNVLATCVCEAALRLVCFVHSWVGDWLLVLHVVSGGGFGLEHGGLVSIHIRN